jgi:hypothetical protein
MNWALIFAATLVACEILLALPFQAKLSTVTGFSTKAARVVSSAKVSDHWKERALPAFALRIGLACMALLGMLVLIIVPFGLAGLLYDGGPVALTETMLRPLVTLGMIVGSIGYMKLRVGGGAKAQSDYSATDRFLHRVALGAPVLPEVIHDVERGLYLKGAPPSREGAHVFVCGLARAGTTILTRELYNTGQFGSLTYRDMPFVMAPNLWNNLSRSSKMEAKDRAHGDGIQVDLDSPEALDEVFWRVTCGGDYIRDDGLALHKPDADALSGYADFISLVLRRTGKERYLSKNNNNILRIPALAGYFPKARFIVPVRDPLQHANSLLGQHKRFQTADAFETDYFTWLAHHEFGKAHRPFLFKARPLTSPDDVNYWLETWIATYSHLNAVRTKVGAALRFVSYERLCGDPAYRAALWQSLGIEDAEFAEMREIPQKPVDGVRPELAEAAAALYAEIGRF